VVSLRFVLSVDTSQFGCSESVAFADVLLQVLGVTGGADRRAVFFTILSNRRLGEGLRGGRALQGTQVALDTQVTVESEEEGANLY